MFLQRQKIIKREIRIQQCKLCFPVRVNIKGKLFKIRRRLKKFEHPIWKAECEKLKNFRISFRTFISNEFPQIPPGCSHFKTYESFVRVLEKQRLEFGFFVILNGIPLETYINTQIQLTQNKEFNIENLTEQFRQFSRFLQMKEFSINKVETLQYKYQKVTQQNMLIQNLYNINERQQIQNLFERKSQAQSGPHQEKFENLSSSSMNQKEEFTKEINYLAKQLEKSHI